MKYRNIDEYRLFNYFYKRKNVSTKFLNQIETVKKIDDKFITLVYNTKPNNTNKTIFEGYEIQDINNFVFLNDAENLTEKIPDYLIEKPVFSIIIPFCNSSKTIKKTIRSIQNQSFKSFEIILVNDMSLDNSTKIIEILSKEDKRIKMVENKENSGLLFSRIIGMKFSRGELIYNIDSDDMLAVSYTLEDLYKISKISKVDTIEFNIIQGSIGRYVIVIQTINSKEDYNKILRGKNIINKRYLKNNKILRKDYGAAICKLIRKKVKVKIVNYLEEIGLNNFKNWNYGEDQFLTDLIKLFSETYLYINRIYYFYYRRPSSLCTKFDRHKSFLDHMRYFYYFNEIVKKYKLPNDFLICNIILFLDLRFKLSESDCKSLYNLTIYINLERRQKSFYWKKNNKKLIKLYRKSCICFKL